MNSMIQSFIEWLGFAPNIATIFIIQALGVLAKKAIIGTKDERPTSGYKGWRRVYFVTYHAHPVLLGVLIGLVPGIPIPESFQGDGVAGSILNYAGCGASAMVVYSIIIGNAKSYVSEVKKQVRSTFDQKD